MKLSLCHLVLLALLLSLASHESQCHPNAMKTTNEELKVEIFTDVMDESRIIGGQEAMLGQLPYMVLIEIIYPPNNGKVIGTCTGTLISPEWVMSAGSCVDEAFSYKVNVGLLKRPCEGTCVQTVPIKVIVHERFNFLGYSENDISLFQLQPGAVKINAYVDLIKLPATSDACLVYFGYNATVIGYGVASTDPSVNKNATLKLRYVDVRVLPDNDCLEFWGSVMYSEKQVCVSTDRNKDSCQGDSGGPLVIRDSSGVSTQIGTVSFGDVCANGSPAVYTKVFSFLDWIHEKTGIPIR